VSTASNFSFGMSGFTPFSAGTEKSRKISYEEDFVYGDFFLILDGLFAPPLLGLYV
jgi:hypothetical protein